jgi:hypothetical protein
MDYTAQWIDDVSAITDNAQAELVGCSTMSHPYDVDAKVPSSVSPRRPRPSQISIRDLTPDSESSGTLNEPDSRPTDEESGDLEALSLETGPDDLDDPWPYTFRVSQSALIHRGEMDADHFLDG